MAGSLNITTHPINSIFIDQDLLTNPGRGNNEFKFNFGRNVTTTGTSRISVANFSVPYSWFNISAKLGNNKMGYVWYDSKSYTAPGLAGTFGYAPIDNVAGNPTGSSSGLQFNFTIPDGFYDVKTLNSYLQFIMIQNGHYAIDNNTNNYIYFLELVENTGAYRDQINSYNVPATPPTHWSPAPPPPSVPTGGYNISGNNPSGQPNPNPWYTPKLVLSDQNLGSTNLFIYFGVRELIPRDSHNDPIYPYQQCVPDTSTNFPPVGYQSIAVLGNFAPMQSPVHSVVLTCDIVKNPLRSTAQHAVSSYVVTTQNISVPFGKDISNSNFFTTWIPLLGGQTVQSLTFNLLDQEGDPIWLEDPDTNIELLITDLQY
jgi:hypothetical protein